MEMKNADFDTMHGIVQDLILDDEEQLRGFVADCQMLGARKTAKYVKKSIQEEYAPDRSIIQMHLAEDFTGC